MEIIVGKKSGFCIGVEKAVKTALECQSGDVCTLGEIIHNPLIINKLKSKGIASVESADLIQCSTVIIRSHGTTKSILEDLAQRAINIIDCTCNFVKKVHNIVEEYYKKGYKIVIIGDALHPEIIGTNGWCENSALIIGDAEEKIELENYEKVCIVVQTTFSVHKFDEIIKNIDLDSIKTVEVFNTICYTTKERQSEAENLSKVCDAMVVVGGKNSANTTKLYELCKKHCKNVFFIESYNDLNLNDIINLKKIGIVAGASTPKELIQEVFLRMTESINEAQMQSGTVDTNETQAQEKDFMAQVMDEMPEKKKFKIGQIIKATISAVTQEGVSVLLPAQKSEIFIDKSEVSFDGNFNVDDFKIFDEIDVAVIGLQPKLQLSIKALEQRNKEETEIDKIIEGAEFMMTFDSFNKGGLTGNFGSYNVFVPASEIRIGFVEKIDAYVGKPLKLKAKDVDKKRKKIVASQKEILLKEKESKKIQKEQKEQELLGSLEVGQIVKGKVVRAANFGVFVSVKGFDCLAHKTDLSWTRVDNCEDVITIGETYDFKVLKIDAETKRVSLGLKQLQEHPWEIAASKYNVGDTIKGIVVRFASFGAFVEVEKGIEGLVHVSQITHDWIEKVDSALEIGSEIEAKIIELDTKEKKMTLSIKALLPAPERAERPERADRTEDGEGAPRRPRNTDKFKRDANTQPERKDARPPKKRENALRQRGDMPTEWISESGSGASIGELLNGLKFDDID